MDVAPPLQQDLEEALAAAAAAHHEYERTVLNGERDTMWAGFYAAFVLGHFGEFTTAGRLAILLAEVGVDDDWSAVAAEHVLRKLRN
jgi:hypothetical protein